jgi:hypothetical protein
MKPFGFHPEARAEFYDALVAFQPLPEGGKGGPAPPE